MFYSTTLVSVDGSMDSNTTDFINDAIDSLEDELESLRRVPPWAVAVIVLVSVITCCVSCVTVILFLVQPIKKWFSGMTRRQQAERAVDFHEGIRRETKIKDEVNGVECRAMEVAVDLQDDDLNLPAKKKKKKKAAVHFEGEDDENQAP